jgi:hypothetical protein
LELSFALAYKIVSIDYKYETNRDIIPPLWERATFQLHFFICVGALVGLSMAAAVVK